MKKPQLKKPKTKLGRSILGWALVIGGIFGFLPILGFWMIPLGIVILSADSPYLRRWRRKAEVWIGKKWKRNNRSNDN
ncbi:PGPGW domain-containing protein [Sneathiella sp.]|uniref:PGPGW domain-containing protein n=1 Tax=Sneathiella sp. TaxID=1964365 RepID=UPI002623A344|nr:PGPGW domain-containing protein [Sneathiella sp.]MDF2368313.1 PGPGW domain-containing protein [Sneathiella sp.]